MQLGVVFTFVILFSHSVVSFAQSSGGGLGAFSPVTGGMNLGSVAAPTVIYGGNTTLGHAEPTLAQHRLSVSTPVHKNAKDTYSLSLSAASLHFGDTVVLSGVQKLSEDFYKLDVGGAFSRQLEGGRNFAMRMSIGSASDVPSSRDMTFSANASYSYPGSETSHWVLTVFISNNNPIANYIPIPGFIYFYRSEKFIGMFGLPFASMQWMPVNPWTFSLSIFGPSISSEVSDGSRDQTQTFAGLSWSQQSYLRHDRSEDKDRLYLSEMKAVTGLRSPLDKKTLAELQAGYSFNRVVYEGPRFNKRDRGSADLSNAWFVQWNLRYIF